VYAAGAEKEEELATVDVLAAIVELAREVVVGAFRTTLLVLLAEAVLIDVLDVLATGLLVLLAVLLLLLTVLVAAAEAGNRALQADEMRE